MEVGRKRGLNAGPSDGRNPKGRRDRRHEKAMTSAQWDMARCCDLVTQTKDFLLFSDPHQAFTSKMQSYRITDDHSAMIIPDLGLKLKPDIATIELPSSAFNHYFDLKNQFPVNEFLDHRTFAHLFKDGHIFAVGRLESEVLMADYLNRKDVLGIGAPMTRHPLVKTAESYAFIERYRNHKNFVAKFKKEKDPLPPPSPLSATVHSASNRASPTTAGQPTQASNRRASVIPAPCSAVPSPSSAATPSTSDRTSPTAPDHLQQVPKNPLLNNIFINFTPTSLAAFIQENISSEGRNTLERAFLQLDAPAIKKNLVTNIASVTINNSSYDILQELFRSQVFCGRGTRVSTAKLPDVSAPLHPADALADASVDVVHGPVQPPVHAPVMRASVKGSWILCAQQHTEADFLRGLSAFPPCPFIPRLVDAFETQRTSLIRTPAALAHSQLSPDALERIQAHFRELRLLILSPVGEELTQVTSLTELLGVFLDIAKTIKFLAQCQCVHRDISFGNILVKTSPITWSEAMYMSSAPTRGAMVADIRMAKKCHPGLLIDFDYAGFLRKQGREKGPPLAEILDVVHDSQFRNVSLPILNPAPDTAADFEHSADSNSPAYHSSSNPPASQESLSSEAGAEGAEAQPSKDPLLGSEQGIRTGTAPFMAIPVLIHALEHQPGFDLESLVYVMIYFCTHYSQLGPTLIRQHGLFDKDDRYAPIASWFLGVGNFQDLGNMKIGQMHFSLEHQVLSYLSPFFHLIRPIIRKLWVILYPSFTSPNNADDPSSFIKQMEKEMVPANNYDKFIIALENAIISKEIQEFDAKHTTARQPKRNADSARLPQDLQFVSQDPCPSPKKKAR
ncbi:hypothetical protein C0991_003252 [Blastosporella zonata]|nr:hypothetical protein C0991_003252 [Blastosporella zonata]